MIVPVTLAMAAAAAFINLWLSLRIGAVRRSAKVLHGDGGDPLLGRRMRAQLNFVENTPFVLVLILAIELSTRATGTLAIVGLVYMVGRVAHGLGMDAERGGAARMVGTVVTLLVLAGLAVWAVVLGYQATGSFGTGAGTDLA